jgi:hypothetical protein
MQVMGLSGYSYGPAAAAGLASKMQPGGLRVQPGGGGLEAALVAQQAQHAELRRRLHQQAAAAQAAAQVAVLAAFLRQQQELQRGAAAGRQLGAAFPPQLASLKAGFGLRSFAGSGDASGAASPTIQAGWGPGGGAPLQQARALADSSPPPRGGGAAAAFGAVKSIWEPRG